MTDTSQPKTKTAIETIAASAVAISPASLAMALPEPYSRWVLWLCAGVTGICYAATFIPVPTNPTGKMAKVYKIISILAGNAGRATNATVAIAGAEKARSDAGVKK